MFDMGASAVIASDVGSVGHYQFAHKKNLMLFFLSSMIIRPETSETRFLAGG
jgi:hypothetical protein